MFYLKQPLIPNPQRKTEILPVGISTQKKSFKSYNMLLTPAPAFEYPIFIDISSPSGIYTEIILHVQIITLLLKSLICLYLFI